MVAWMYCLAEDYPIGDNEALCDSVARAEEALGTVQVYGVEFIPDEDVFPTEGEESEGDE